MHESEPKIVKGEKVSGVEPKDRRTKKLEQPSQNNLSTKARKLYEEELSEGVPTADAEEYRYDTLMETGKRTLSFLNPRIEQCDSGLPMGDSKIVLGKVQRRTRIKQTPDQDGDDSEELRTKQVKMSRIEPTAGQAESTQRTRSAIDGGTLPMKGEPEKLNEMDRFIYTTDTRVAFPKQASPDPQLVKPEQFYLLPKIINGGFAGVVGVSLIFPLDFVKTRLQTQKPGPDGQLMYKSIYDCFKKTIKTEGYFGMYRGSAVNIILVTPENAIKLSANDYFRYHLTKPNGELPLSRQMVAGGLAGFFQILVTTPMELLKIRMQTSGQAIAAAKAAGKPVPHITPFTIVASLMKENGIFGLYKGFAVTILRDVLFSIIFFPLFAAFNEVGPKSPDGSGDATFWWSFASGAVAGSITALTVTPADVVKTRLQNQKKVEGVVPEYLSIADCFAKTYRREGLKAFFKGGACRVMVVAPLFGITQAVYYLGFAENVFGLKNR